MACAERHWYVTRAQKCKSKGMLRPKLKCFNTKCLDARSYDASFNDRDYIMNRIYYIDIFLTFQAGLCVRVRRLSCPMRSAWKLSLDAFISAASDMSCMIVMCSQ